MLRLMKEEVSEWFDSPVTKEYFNILKQEAILRRESAAYGSLQRDTIAATGEAYLRAMIMAEVYEACAEPTIDDILPEEVINE